MTVSRERITEWRIIMGRLDGKVAVITGGNSGVGAATAKLFAKEGATVVITARREAALKEVADEITAAGGEVYAVSTDISKPEDPEALMQKIMDKYGKIDILVIMQVFLSRDLSQSTDFLMKIWIELLKLMKKELCVV